MQLLNSWNGAYKLISILGVLHFLLIFALLLLAFWFVKKLELKAFPKAMLLIIISICILIMIIYVFLAIFAYDQVNQLTNLLKPYGIGF